MKDIHGTKNYTIYGLTDPDTNEVRYVGRTTTALSLRLAHHVASARGGSEQFVAMWVRSLLNVGKRPQIVSLHNEDCRKARAIRLERYFMRAYKDNYLFNVAPAY